VVVFQSLGEVEGTLEVDALWVLILVLVESENSSSLGLSGKVGEQHSDGVVTNNDLYRRGLRLENWAKVFNAGVELDAGWGIGLRSWVKSNPTRFGRS
jgi:hypothetical protein